ncbi:murein hydrolase activator EnvC family protein [Sphingobacterium paucimobilis]|uniref:M23ase beta-sheet core domain-containing protein n=1 Tax=Sphingobacterium paucimobilis HER1398 TaxID=1346330 RepID=U2J7B0_9SPHI|nr:peptidoglycan DD-metalloendopeptidase family protein [Sphingobacterium paucimobilis]ERJ60814.1 hypothetical protein M472_18840 [Sphingobacterium paucimobilis HER1398]
MVFKKILLSIFIIGACAHFSYGQSSAELKKQLEKINADISALNKELSAKTKEKLLSQKEVNALSRQLNLREDKITIINRELVNLSKQINDNTKSVNALKAELEKMRQDYEKMVMFAFRNKNAYNKMMFIFASKDFNQAFKRVKYLQQFTDARKIKAAEIEGVRKEIELKIARLEADRKTQNELLAEQRKEKDVIAKDRSEHQVQLNQLAKEEKSFQGQLSAKQQERKKLNSLIKTAIAREAAEERRKAEEARQKAALAESKKTGKSVEDARKEIDKRKGADVIASTPEVAKLSASFQANRGGLPWPVAQGNIVRNYGSVVVEHGVRDFYDYIRIRTGDGAAVKSVFSGTVVQVVSMGTSAVVVKHGNYYTAYSNLKTTSVSKGQSVSTGTVIGTAAGDAEEGFSYIDFSVFQGETVLDPSAWIAR